MKFVAAVIDFKLSFERFDELHFCPGETNALRLRRDLQAAAVPLHDVVVTDAALVKEAADAIEFLGNRPRKREYVVKWGLKPLLGKFGLPTKGVGLHAFRHGLGTALSESKVSPKTVQQILRHSDFKTTFRYYVHSDTDAQRNTLEKISIGTNVPIGTGTTP
jgi:integrase